MPILSSELVAEVAANLKIGATSDSYTKFKIYEKLNDVQLEILNRAGVKWLTIARKSVIMAATTSSTIQWKSDFLRFIAAYRSASEITTINRGTRCYEYDLNHPQPMKDLASVDFPFIDPHRDGGYEIRPAGTTFYHRVEYVYRLPVISASQNCLLDAKWKSVLSTGTTARCAMIDNYRPEMAAKYQKLFETSLEPFLPMKESPV